LFFDTDHKNTLLEMMTSPFLQRQVVFRYFGLFLMSRYNKTKNWGTSSNPINFKFSEMVCKSNSNSVWLEKYFGVFWQFQKVVKGINWQEN